MADEKIKTVGIAPDAPASGKDFQGSKPNPEGSSKTWEIPTENARKTTMAKDIGTMVAELADREAIRELPIKYCDCVWRGDMTGIVDLFAADGAFITKGMKRDHTASGREGLLKLYGGLTGGALTPRPYIHNHVLQLDGNGRASGRCYVEIRDQQKEFEWVGTGFYEDKYVKVGDGWKFQSRTFTTAYMKRMPG